MSTKLYNDVAADCAYCERAKESDVGLVCARRGAVEKGSSCRAFVYDPLKRVPVQRPRLPEFDPEEFRV